MENNKWHNLYNNKLRQPTILLRKTNNNRWLVVEMANQQEVGEHLSLTKQYVSNLVSQGILPKGIGRGGMDVDACRKAYIDYLR